jgi:hypothetical protein
MSFDKTTVAVPPSNGELSVAVWDARPYVLTGEKSPEWVGLQRSGWGIPYGVHTQSNNPLSSEFAQSILSSFGQAGGAKSSVTIPNRTSTIEAVTKMLPSRGKVLLLEISEWKTDTLSDINFSYDLKVKVLNNGALVAEERTHGNEKLKGSMWNPIGASERVAVAKQKEKLDELFSFTSIKNALASSTEKGATRRQTVAAAANAAAVAPVAISEPPAIANASPKTSGSCSVEQVLAMKSSGLSDVQIRAACSSPGL